MTIYWRAVHLRPTVDLRPMSHVRFCRASLTRAFSHRIEQRSILKMSRATVRRAMTQRATRHATLATLSQV